MDTSAISMTAIKNIHSFEQLKAFEAKVYEMRINWTLRDKLIRQATQNYFESTPLN